jgi:hypothetical protein
MRLPLVVTLVLAAAAGIAVSAHGHRAALQGGRLELIASVHRVTVKGVTVTGLYPGAVKTLPVAVTNGEPFPIKLAALTSTIAANTGRLGCTNEAVNLVVTAPRGSVRLAPRKNHRYVVTVRMPKTVADACQGAKFKITVKAHATR